MKLISALAICASIAAYIVPRAYSQQQGQQLRVGGNSDSNVLLQSDERKNDFDNPGSNTTTDDSDENNHSPYNSVVCNCGAGRCDQRGCAGTAICGAGKVVTRYNV